MAITDVTVRLVNGMRVEIDGRVDGQVRALTSAWVDAWAEISADWAAAADAVVAAAGVQGSWPTITQILRLERAARAQAATVQALHDLAASSATSTGALVKVTVDSAALWHARLTASQYPAAAGDQAALAVNLNRVDPISLDAIVRRTTEQITATSRPLADAATSAMNSALRRAIALGNHPEVAARRMVASVHGAFNGGLTRAATIARTEVLDAHRAAGLAADQANRDVLTGWTWSATLDERTCPSCWAQNGTTHDVDDPGPQDHQCGRCVRIPTTKSWADLGFPSIAEPASVLPDQDATEGIFNALPHDKQLAIMGPGRLAALTRGDATWADLSTRRTTSGWRDSFAPTPVRDLVRSAAA